MAGSNRLIGEKSPYLRQHAHNPVDWYPWGEEAFRKAKLEGKPVFLSIGYSTCHWCHVMAEESFEDEGVAALLNSGYVSIKVDREERPDIDHAYMAVCQALTGQGGWPLTIIMTPEKAPFFAGTYLPKEVRFGMPGLKDVLRRCREVWDETGGDPPEARALVDAARAAGAGKGGAEQPGSMDRGVLDMAYGELALTFDEVHGGFGGAPKFPMPHNIVFLIRYWRLTGKARALEMAEITLQSMRDGGIFDQVGHGFCRYSTDDRWAVPHFEKMLYDNALLAYAYLEAYLATRNTWYRKVAREVFGYLEREMTSPEGGLYSAEDADSEGEEGKYYRWTEKEIRGVLGPEDGGAMSKIYGIEGDGGGVPRLVRRELSREAARRGLTAAGMEGLYESWRLRLLEARGRRVRPAKDRKVLASWNGLAIASLAKGAAALGDRELAAKAEKAARFVLGTMLRQDGRLLARYIDGEARYPAFLDDYAFISWGLQELYGATFDQRHMDWAVSLTKAMLTLFGDSGGGGLFFDGRDASELPFRPRELHDGALPSGNSVAVMNLLRLSRATGDIGLGEEGARLLRAIGERASQYPSSYAFLMAALLYELGPSQEIVLAGRVGEEDTERMIGMVRRIFLPNASVILNSGEGGMGSLSRAVEGKGRVGGRATLHLCVDRTCLPPFTDPDDAERVLRRP